MNLNRLQAWLGGLGVLLLGLNASAGVSAGETRANISLSSGAYCSAQPDAVSAMEPVLVYPLRDDALLMELARQLTRGLAIQPPFSTVRLAAPAGKASGLPLIPIGQRLPEMFLLLDEGPVSSRGIWNQESHYQYQFSLGRDWAGSSVNVTDETSPPLVNYQWQATLEATRHTRGFGLSSDPVVAAEMVAKVLADLNNSVASHLQENPLAPEEYTAFIPPYEPLPQLPPLERMKARLLCSGPRLFSPNETFWLLPSQTDPLATLKSLKSQLREADWKVDSSDFELTHSAHLRMRRSGAVLRCFATVKSFEDWRTNTLPLVVHYRVPLGKTELARMIDSLCDSGSQEAGLPFISRMSARQKSAFFQRMRAEASPTARLLLAMAEDAGENGRTNEARVCLARARLLVFETPDKSWSASRWEKLEKITGPVNRLEPDAEDLRALGFLNLEPDAALPSAEKPLGEPLRFAWLENGKWHLGSYVFKKPAQGESKLYPCFLRQASEGSSSTISSASPLSAGTDTQQGLTLTGKPVIIHARLSSDRQKIGYQFARPNH
jgi:hypothetical protein